MTSFIVNRENSGQTVIKYLNRLMPDAPSGLLFKQMRNKNIVLNGKKISGNEKLKENDKLDVFMSDETILKFKGSVKIDLSEYEKAFEKFKNPDIVYEDEHIILLNKPVGVLSQKAEKDDLSANEWLIGYLLNKGFADEGSLSSFKPSVCNRLDRNTGGILIFGKSLFGTQKMSALIKDRSIKKYYKTIVKGRVSKDAYLEGYVKKDDKLNKVSFSKTEKPGYSLVKTFISPVRYNGALDITELEVLLITGKTHQIRVHLSSIGHPVIGDEKYGDKALNQLLLKKFRLKNQLLFAYKLSFPEMPDYKEISGKSFEINLNREFNRYFTEE